MIENFLVGVVAAIVASQIGGKNNAALALAGGMAGVVVGIGYRAIGSAIQRDA